MNCKLIPVDLVENADVNFLIPESPISEPALLTLAAATIAGTFTNKNDGKGLMRRMEINTLNVKSFFCRIVYFLNNCFFGHERIRSNLNAIAGLAEFRSLRIEVYLPKALLSVSFIAHKRRNQAYSGRKTPVVLPLGHKRKSRGDVSFWGIRHLDCSDSQIIQPGQV